MRPTRRAVLLAPAALALPRPALAQPADTFNALLAEEHAAIHLYGVLGPRLPEPLRQWARAAYDDHRRHRDTLVELVRRAGGTPVPAELTYALPSKVDGPATARSAALLIEDALCVRWRAAVAAAEAAERRAVASAFGDEAEHLTTLRWSATSSVKQSTTAFPGR